MAVMLVIGFYYLASGLLAPLWAVAILLVIWLALFVLGCVWFRRHPLRVLAIPLAAVVIWYGTISAGGAFLGWTP